jgi:hypothetical protein
MTFWSSQKLKTHLPSLISPFNEQHWQLPTVKLLSAESPAL